MTIKIQSKSQYAFAIFLAGSVCGLTHNMQANDDKTPADQVETTTHRLQITGATQQILAAIDDAVEVLNGADVPAGTVIVGGTAYTANTNDLTSISLAIAAIEGADFDTESNSLNAIYNEAIDMAGANFNTDLASLYIIARQVAVGQVLAAESSAVIALPVTVSGGTSPATFNNNMITLFTNLKSALDTPNYTTINAVLSAINVAQTNLGSVGTINSAYPLQAIQAGLQSLETGINSWLAFYTV